MPKLKCMTNPTFKYWFEVNGFCEEHKESICDRIDKVIEAEVKSIAADYGLTEFGSIDDDQKPEQMMLSEVEAEGYEVGDDGKIVFDRRGKETVH
jgi:hypothetical protein